MRHDADRAKADPGTLTLGQIDSPLGLLWVVTDRDGAVRALDFADFEDRMRRLLGRHYGSVTLTAGSVPETVESAFAAYFAGDGAALNGLEVRTGGTDFQRQVWAGLRQIPAGETRSYGDLARLIGRDKAVRAVGLANGANPVGIIVPCHRVIGSNGSLTGYAGGVDRKRWLLEHEAKT